MLFASRISFFCLWAAIVFALPGHIPSEFVKQHHPRKQQEPSMIRKQVEFTDIHQQYVQFEDERLNPTSLASALADSDRCSTVTSTLTSTRTVAAPDPSKPSLPKRQLSESGTNPLGGLISGLADALGPAFSAALAPVQSAANSNLAGISLVRSEAPKVLPTADVISPARSAAAPVLSQLLGDLISMAQPLVNGAESAMTGAAPPVETIAAALQPIVLPIVESAIGPLISAIAPAVVAGLVPAESVLSSPLGAVESGLIAPLESAVAPLLSDVIKEVASALTGVEAPVASLVDPLLGAVDRAVLPLVTSVVSAVWPTIGPSVTPLNPVICALQPAEVPLGQNITALIPVQCVSITSGEIIPISTGIATPLPVSIAPSTTRTTAALGGAIPRLTANMSRPLPAASITPTLPSASNFILSASLLASSLVNAGANNSSSNTTDASIGNSQPISSTTVTKPDNSLGVAPSPLSAVIPPDPVSGLSGSSVSGPDVMTCVQPAATVPASEAAQQNSGMQPQPAANTQSQSLAASAASQAPVSSKGSVQGASQALQNGQSSPVAQASAVTPSASIPAPGAPAPTPAITQGPIASSSGNIYLVYNSQTVSFPAMMLPGGAMIASFMGSIFAVPATAQAAPGLAKRMEPIDVGRNFDFDVFAHELSSKLAEKFSPAKFGSSSDSRDQTVISTSKDLPHHQAKVQVQTSRIKDKLLSPGQAGPVISEAEKAGGARLQISTCPDAEGTTFISAQGANYSIICDTNWIGRDVEYLLSSTFDKCVDACDALNSNARHIPCAAALFVENAPSGAADCYLKSATDNPSGATGNYTFQAAVLQSHADTSKPQNSIIPGYDHNSGGSTLVSDATATSSLIPTPTSGQETSSALVLSGISFADGTSIITPSVSTASKLAVATNQPASQYISSANTPESAPTPISKRQDINGIPESLLNGTGADFALALDEIDKDTGVVQLNNTANSLLLNLTNHPHLSRDGGKGGMINGQHIFMFADTAVYTTEIDDTNGHFVNYASSSVATDVGQQAAAGNALILSDNSGEFATVNGALRGFAPLTTGETGFNGMAAQAGVPARYSVWPESSLIPLNSSASIAVAPIVFSTTDKSTGAGKFTYAGNTLLTVTANDATSGPVAERTIGRLFNASQVEWGNIGGLRSWGASGPGGNNGYVYLFGNVRDGLLLARTEPSNVANVSSYRYWSGTDAGWTSEPLKDDSTPCFLEGSFMDIDIFYSPRHLTFVAVYMSIYGDSTFYWRYLDAPQALYPTWLTNSSGSSSVNHSGLAPTEDFAEALTKYRWSDERVLLDAGTGLNGAYAYAGGVHAGYFGQDDIVNGGNKMLLTWTSPTGRDPASRESAYQLGTGVVTWS